MARQDHDAFVVATIRNGRMAAARRFTAREVDVALAVAEAIEANGDEARVSIFERSDGQGVTEFDRERLMKLHA